MGYQFVVDDLKNILFIVYEGELCLSDRELIREETYRKLREEKMKKLFIDVTKCKFNMSLNEYFSFSCSFDQNEVPSNMKIAVFIREFDFDNKFLTKLFFNNGLKAKAFSSFDEALEWIE